MKHEAQRIHAQRHRNRGIGCSGDAAKFDAYPLIHRLVYPARPRVGVR
jgi:hypothetical protein